MSDAPHARHATPQRRLALTGGVAGLAYVPLAALEGADVLAAPELGDRAAVIRAYVEEHPDAMTLTVTAGLASLVAYAVFAVCLFLLLRPADGRLRSPWPVVGLVGALAGALLAAVGQSAVAVVLAQRDTLDEDDITSLWDFSIDARTWAGFLGALALFGFGAAARPATVMPRALSWAAMGLAVLLLGASAVAVANDTENARLVVLGVFGLAALWVLLVAAWLTLGHDAMPSAVLLLRQFASLVLVLAAGVTGLALLVLPGATAQLFSWGLGPRPLTSVIAAFYLASAVVFARTLWLTRRQTRGLMTGAFVFATSTIVVTLAHTEVFDFDRLQAVAWVVLFPLFALAVAIVLIWEPDTEPVDRGPRLTSAPRAAAGVLAVALAGSAIALWVDPRAVGDALPYALTPLGGRFLGCWLALLAVLAAWVFARPNAADARVPAFALVVFPLGASFAAARVASDLDGAAETAGYATAIVAVLAVGVWLSVALRDR